MTTKICNYSSDPSLCNNIINSPLNINRVSQAAIYANENITPIVQSTLPNLKNSLTTIGINLVLYLLLPFFFIILVILLVLG